MGTAEVGEVFEQTAEYVNPKEDDIELLNLTVERGLTPKTERYNICSAQMKLSAIVDNAC